VKVMMAYDGEACAPILVCEYFPVCGTQGVCSHTRGYAPQHPVLGQIYANAVVLHFCL